MMNYSQNKYISLHPLGGCNKYKKNECTEKKQIQTADLGSFVITLVHTTWDVWSANISMINIFVELI